jgi:AcrR family transcriptional regulator
MTAKNDLRQKVLSASLVMIEERGLDRFSMREVARKAGVSHQAPYHHFGDRQAILAAIASEGFAKLTEEMERALGKCGRERSRAIEAIARAYVAFALRHPSHFQVMFRSDAVPIERYPRALENADNAFGALVKVIDKSFAGTPHKTRRNLAFAAWAFTHGLATLILDGPLARRAGVSKSQHRELAARVIRTFGAYWNRGGPSPNRKTGPRP